MTLDKSHWKMWFYLFFCPPWRVPDFFWASVHLSLSYCPWHCCDIVHSQTLAGCSTTTRQRSWKGHGLNVRIRNIANAHFHWKSKKKEINKVKWKKYLNIFIDLNCHIYTELRRRERYSVLRRYIPFLWDSTPVIPEPILWSPFYSMRMHPASRRHQRVHLDVAGNISGAAAKCSLTDPLPPSDVWTDSGIVLSVKQYLNRIFRINRI